MELSRLNPVCCLRPHPSLLSTSPQYGDNFNAVARRADRRLAALGASPLLPGGRQLALGDEDGGRLVEQFKGWSTAVVGALMASSTGGAAAAAGEEGLSMAAAEAGEEEEQEGEEGEDTFDELDEDDDDGSEVRACVWCEWQGVGSGGGRRVGV